MSTTVAHRKREFSVPLLHALIEKKTRESRLKRRRQDTQSGLMSRFCKESAEQHRNPAKQTPFQRMEACRHALNVLDANGWSRSYHQRLFHEDFLVR